MRFVIVGRVHPERADVWFLPQTWSVTEGHTLGGAVFTLSCQSSQVTIVADLPSTHPLEAFVNAEHVAQAVVSALGFSTGTGYGVELIQVVTEASEVLTFGQRPEGLGFDDPMVFPRAADLAKVDVFFRLAMRDYVRAISQVMDCGHYCYRSVEAIKSSFAGWPEMHTALGTTREEIDTHVKAYADPVRHGNWIAMKPASNADRFKMLQVTRSILARYLDLKYPPPRVAPAAVTGG